ncbi:hypothetical protein [Bacillus mycoides]|uniref:hypothetical protein n=1 Tax=Bacillus mycoides TaxID=1405 RepID=UPI00273CBB7F|nr:hypothetical protein [Bacillus mycoides]
MTVRYIGGMDFHDGVTSGNVYKVIEENEHQYIVNNDLGGTSTLKKSKFVVITS